LRTGRTYRHKAGPRQDQRRCSQARPESPSWCASRQLLGQVSCRCNDCRIPSAPSTLCRTLNWDQVKEMFQHARIEDGTGLQIYFADPHWAWRRGTTENTSERRSATTLRINSCDDHTARRRGQPHTLATHCNKANTGGGMRHVSSKHPLPAHLTRAVIAGAYGVSVRSGCAKRCDMAGMAPP
jgi:hypothetical protein